MKKLIRISFITALIAASDFVSAEVDSRPYSQGEVFIEYGTFDKDSKTGDELKTILRCASCPGVDGYLPSTETVSMGIVVRGDRFTVQPSLISSLYDLHVGPEFYKRTFSVNETSNGVVVSVSGGDGSGSYDVQFEIDLIDMQVVRKLYQFPDRETPTITTGEVVYAGKTP